MEDLKHTPGPWSFRKMVAPGMVWDGQHEVNYGLDGECVAEVVFEEANARAIATTPELLAELIAIAKAVDESHDAYQLAANMVASNPKRKELIRKATQP